MALEVVAHHEEAGDAFADGRAELLGGADSQLPGIEIGVPLRRVAGTSLLGPPGRRV